MITFWMLFLMFILSVPVCGVFATHTNADITSPIQVEVEDTLLTIKVQRVPLKNILTEISNQTDIKFVFLVSLDEPYDTSFTRLPMEKGLKQLLHGYNYSITFHAEKSMGGEQRIKKVIVLSKDGEGSQRKTGENIASPGDPVPGFASEEMEEQWGISEGEGGNETFDDSMIDGYQGGGMLEESPEEIEPEMDPVNEEMLREIEREEMERGGRIDYEDGDV